MKKFPFFEHHSNTPLLHFHEIIDAEWTHYDLPYIGIYFHLIIVHLKKIAVNFFLYGFGQNSFDQLAIS